MNFIVGFFLKYILCLWNGVLAIKIQVTIKMLLYVFYLNKVKQKVKMVVVAERRASTFE